MRCILEGHVPVTQQGKGEFKGRSSTFCGVCGKEFEHFQEADYVPSAPRPPITPITIDQRRVNDEPF